MVEKLQQKLAELFAAFDADEPLNLSEYRAEIEELVSEVGTEYAQYEACSAERNRLADENAGLRGIIADECRAKLILLNDPDADARANELAGLPLEKLISLREEITGRFDRVFTVRERDAGQVTEAAVKAPEHYRMYRS